MAKYNLDRTLNQMMAFHPMSGTANRIKKDLILSAFSNWVQKEDFCDWHLSLYRFAAQKPLCFINPKIVDEALGLFKNQPTITLTAITNCEEDISHALLSLIRPGSSWEKDDQLSIETPNDLVQFEGIWHPEYLRYCDQIYNHLIQIPLAILGYLKGKKYTEQTLSNRSATLATLGFSSLTTGYNSTIRNALSHGHISFGMLDVTYTDNHKQVKLPPFEFSVLFDNLVDSCHSIVVALLIFLSEVRSLVEQNGLHTLPFGIRFYFIDGLTYHQGLRLVSLIESQILGTKKQLNLVCEMKSTARSEQKYEAIFLCWVACKFGGKYYNRYDVSIDCGMPSFATIILNGDQIRQAIDNDDMLSVCGPKLIESDLLWYNAPAIKTKINTLRTIFATQWEIAKPKLLNDFEHAGIKIFSRYYSIVDIKNTSPSSFRRIEAYLILKNCQNPIRPMFILQIIDHAISKLKAQRVRLKDLYGEKGIPAKPFSIVVRLYSQDRRLRKLKDYTIQNDEFVLIAEWSQNWKIASPIYTHELGISISWCSYKV